MPNPIPELQRAIRRARLADYYERREAERLKRLERDAARWRGEAEQPQ